MKRYISLILVAAVLITAFALPASAAELPFIDVLDLTTPNNSGSNVFDCISGQRVHFDVDVESIRYIEFTVQFISTTVPTCVMPNMYGNLNLEVIQISPYVYRFVGKPVYDFVGGFDLIFYGPTNCKAEFYNMKIATTEMVYDNPISGYMAWAQGEESYFYFNSPSDYAGATVRGSDNYLYDDYRSYIDLTNWRKFDYIDLTVFASYLSINSITVELDGVVVPYTVSYLNSNSLSDQVVTLSLDLSNLDKSVTTPIEVVFAGSLSGISTAIGVFSVIGSTGYIKYEGINLVLNYWNKGILFLTGQFNLISTWIHNQTSLITGSIAEWGQSIFSSVTTVGSKIDNWGQQIVDALVGQNSDDSIISDAIENQEQVNQEVNLQLQSAVGSWSDNVGVVTQGFNLALTNATPALIWISGMAQNVFSGMGWFGNIFFFLGFLHVFFLLMSKSGLGRAIDRADKRGDD